MPPFISFIHFAMFLSFLIFPILFSFSGAFKNFDSIFKPNLFRGVNYEPV